MRHSFTKHHHPLCSPWRQANARSSIRIRLSRQTLYSRLPFRSEEGGCSLGRERLEHRRGRETNVDDAVHGILSLSESNLSRWLIKVSAALRWQADAPIYQLRWIYGDDNESIAWERERETEEEGEHERCFTMWLNDCNLVFLTRCFLFLSFSFNDAYASRNISRSSSLLNFFPVIGPLRFARCDYPLLVQRERKKWSVRD